MPRPGASRSLRGFLWLLLRLQPPVTSRRDHTSRHPPYTPSVFASLDADAARAYDWETRAAPLSIPIIPTEVDPMPHRPWIAHYVQGTRPEIPPIQYKHLPDMMRYVASRFGPRTARTEWPWLVEAAKQLSDAVGVDTAVSEIVTDPWTLHTAYAR